MYDLDFYFRKITLGTSVVDDLSHEAERPEVPWKANGGSLGRTLRYQHRKMDFVSVHQEGTWPELL